AYTRFFHHYDDSPILIVNASEINPIEREEDYANLLSEIGRTRAGRHFFNPRAAALPPTGEPGMTDIYAQPESLSGPAPVTLGTAAAAQEKPAENRLPHGL
ncbi:deoxynucleoside kinase, partial [mine drainage metagenome]